MNFRNDETNQNERGDVHRAGNDERRRVAVTVVAQPADNLAEQHAAHRAAETDEAGERADGAFGNHVRRQNHHERGPRLLAEKREAENENHPADGMQLRHEHHPRHQRRARAEGELARGVHGNAALEQPARKSAADQTADAGSRVRNPADAARRFDVELKRVEQILRQPEQIKIPRAVAQKFRAHDRPRFAVSKQTRRAGFSVPVRWTGLNFAGGLIAASDNCATTRSSTAVRARRSKRKPSATARGRASSHGSTPRR